MTEGGDRGLYVTYIKEPAASTCAKLLDLFVVMFKQQDLEEKIRGFILLWTYCIIITCNNFSQICGLWIPTSLEVSLTTCVT